MSNIYEVVVSAFGLELFEDAFPRYMDGLHFRHMKIGGWLGDHTSHEFQKGDHLVSCTTSNEGQSHFKIVVLSDTEDVEQLVLGSLTEGMADLLEDFGERVSDPSSQQTLRSLSRGLRDAFD
ncbi:MAG: hypothetical protein BZY67_01260 [SAR202 cluster bacterium Io17-Chloro-G1]|nr:MAG: hypothetical protein BZY67_01260 [SAR202 cluster bacterium Io17-Chloro-G1]